MTELIISLLNALIEFVVFVVITFPLAFGVWVIVKRNRKPEQKDDDLDF